MTVTRAARKRKRRRRRPPDPQERRDFPAASAPETVAFRHRMGEAGEVLSPMAKALADRDPLACGRNAYLTLLGRVFDTLNGKETGIALDDLQVLSKIVAEQRRAETQASELQSKMPGAKDAESGAAPSGAVRPLPANFGEVVRRIYGTNFQPDVGSPPPEPQAKATTEERTANG